MTKNLERLNIELKCCNFEFMKLDNDLAIFYRVAYQAELDFALGAYDNSLVNIRKVSENLADLIIDLNYGVMKDRATFNDKLFKIKGYIEEQDIIDVFYKLKNSGNKGAHGNDNDSQRAFESLKYMRTLLMWYMKCYSKIKIQRIPFSKPEVANRFKNNQERKLIYIQTADNSSGKWSVYEGAEKIGETTSPAEDLEEDWTPNSEFLRSAAEKRLKAYMTTAGVPYKIDWSELAWIKSSKSWFGDKDVHEVLTRSGYKHHKDLKGTEWFTVDLQTAKDAIKAVKEGRSSLTLDKKEKTPKIILRAEQEAAVSQAIKAFKKYKKVLWNAKMRFGKTLSTYDLIKKSGYQKVLVMTHRPVVSDSWFEDFDKSEMAKLSYEFGSKGSKEKSLEKLLESQKPFIYFASIQDLRGAEKVGGKFNKNNEFFDTKWSLVVVDEAHEGTQTERGDNLYEELTTEDTKILELSGTPFNILDGFSEEQVFTWDYIMEQQAKIRFSVENPDKVNPYETLPEIEMFTFQMETDKQFLNSEKYFDFSEFFKVDKETRKFIHENAVENWLDQITKDGEKSCYPFSTEDYRESIRHTLWLLPSRSSAKALKELLDNHRVFKEYAILNIVDNNDDEIKGENDADMDRVRKAITDNPSKTKTIILTVRKLTTGVNIKPLNGVVFLNNTTSAQNYLQAAFRPQTPFSDEVLGMKKKAFIFDFSPDRALNILAKSVSMSPKAGALNTEEQKEKLGTLLNFLPVLEQSGHTMKPYSVNKLMRQLKKAYAEKAVLSGFDDSSIYNDELLKVTQDDATLFNELYAKLGKTQQTKNTNKVDVNIHGLNEEQREKAKRGKRKLVRERTEEEKEAIELEQKIRKERNNMIAILRGISIRIPLMIYGMDMDLDKDIKLDDFIKLIDDVSWEEFMPRGITKKDFTIFKRFYDPDIFIEAGNRIRQISVSANNLSYQNRIEKITSIFSGFKNPDKETVLTPWRVVNMQLGKTIGGFNFFDEAFNEILPDGNYREINIEEVTEKTFSKDTKVLEINSKTGLYPLYMAFNIYQRRFIEESNTWTKTDFVASDKALWNEILEKNIFVLNKTPMARTITIRTLNGYEKNTKFESNLIYVEDLTNKLKNDLEKTENEILKKFGDENMKFDIVVGNPSYQESREDTRDDAIYNYFYDLAEKISSRYCLISPARFLFNGGSTDKNWNKKMLEDKHINIEYYEHKSSKVFPNTDIKGGVVVLHRDESKNFGEIGVFTSFDKLNSIIHKVSPLTIRALDTIISGQGIYKFTPKMHEKHPKVRGILSKSHPNDVGTGVLETLHNIIFHEEEPSDEKKYIKVLGRFQNERVYRWIREDYINKPNGFDKYRVILPKANGSGAIGEVLSTPLIVKPLIGFTQTFISIGAFDNEVEALNVLKYIKSKFARTMLGVLKITQDNPASKWKYVPLQDFTSNSDVDWSNTISEIDQQFYKKYGLLEQEILFIEEKVKPME